MRLSLLVLIIIFPACDKSLEPQTSGDMLTSGPWYPSHSRTVTKDSVGQVISDTTIYISGCVTDKPMFLLRDSSASRDVSCFMLDPKILPGSWGLRADSSFYVFLPFTRCSFATGCIQGNAGIELSKITEITPTSFTAMRSQPKQICPPCHKQTHIEYSTFVRK